MSTTPAPRFQVEAIDLFERDVVLRMPFRFGVVTLTRSPQAFARARIRLADGRVGEGMAAELLAPKWFDKNPALSNEDNFEQLRAALGIARTLYLDGRDDTGFGRFARHYPAQLDRAGARGLNGLVALYGPALLDRALLDALCRALGVPFHEAVQQQPRRPRSPPTSAPTWPASTSTPSSPACSRRRRSPPATPSAWSTRSPRDDQTERVGDGLPETLEEVVAAYGQRWFKLKVAGDVGGRRRAAGADRRRARPHRRRLSLQPRRQRAVRRHRGRARALAADARRAAPGAPVRQRRLRRAADQAADARSSATCSALSAETPVIVDESDDALDAFVRARDKGYRGVSSKTCKGIYKSLINAARCDSGTAETPGRYLMSAEDLTIQAGVGLQQDLALVSLLGIDHVERNGHHYVDGMAALPAAEQQRFLDAHPDLYERSHGAVRVRIRGGELAIGSLGGIGFASGAAPDWASMRAMKTP